MAWRSSAAVEPPQRLMALAVAIIRGPHITNTFNSPLDTFSVVWGFRVWQLETQSRHSDVMGFLLSSQGLGPPPRGAGEAGALLSSWAAPFLTNQPLECCSVALYYGRMLCPWSGHAVWSAFVLKWMQKKILSWKKVVSLIGVVHLLNINCSSPQLIKKGPTVYHSHHVY